MQMLLTPALRGKTSGSQSSELQRYLKSSFGSCKQIGICSRSHVQNHKHNKHIPKRKLLRWRPQRKAYTTDCSLAAILGWRDGQKHTEGYKTHAHAHKYIYKHRTQKKGKKNFKNYSEKNISIQNKYVSQ